MKTPVVAYAGWLLLLSAFGFYFYGFFLAIRLSLGTAAIVVNAFPEPLAGAISSMQALLLANLGVILGISIARPGSAVARQLMLGSKDRTQLTQALPDPLAIREMIQLFAVVVYIISLIACMVTWLLEKDYSTDSKQIVSLIPESGKMFIGVVLAYVTAVLARSTVTPSATS